MPKTKQDQLFFVWQTIIQTQMHFNQMIMRIRAIGASVVVSLFSAAAVVYERFQEASILGISASPFIVLFALYLLLSFYFLDRFYYYQMLLVAVDKAEILEKQLRKADNNFSLTTNISKRISRKTALHFVNFFYGTLFVFGLAFIFYILGESINNTPQS